MLSKELYEIFSIIKGRERILYLILFISIILGGIIDMLGVISLAAILYIFNNSELDSNLLFLLGKNNIEFKLLGIYIFSTIWRFFSQGGIAYMALHFESKLSTKLFENSLMMNTEEFSFENSSTFKKEILTEVQVLTNQIILPGMRIIQSLISSVFILGYLVFVSPIYFIYGFIAIIIFYILASYILSIISKQLGENRFRANEKRFAILEDSMKSIRIIKIFNLSFRYVQDYLSQMRVYAFAQSMLQILGLIPRVILEILLVTFLCIYAVNNIDQVLDQFFLLGASLFRLIPNLQVISQNYARLSFGSVVVKLTLSRLRIKTNDHKSLYEEIESKNKLAEIINKNSNKVKFEFENKTIEKISLPNHGNVLIRGESGVGKTTLIDQLIGINAPTNYLIKKTKSFSLENIFFVPQVISLSSGTYKENLSLLINHEINEKSIKSIFEDLRIIHLYERLIVNNEKIGSSIEFSGISGGELKRIFLSFCFLSKRKIIILDEIFSGIDNQSSEIICEIFNSLRKTKLILIVAHEKFKSLEVDYEFTLRKDL